MVYTDQTGRELSLPKTPQRIVSTVPSQTELLADLGLESQTVGITGFCVRPKAWRKEKSVVGGTKDLQLAAIKALQPDIIIGNKEENVKAQIENLAESIPVWLSNIETVDQALNMINSLGEITGTQVAAQQIIASINHQRKALNPLPQVPTLYFIWKAPYMVAGPATFISSMITEVGLKNHAPLTNQRYPQMDLAAIKASKAELILLSSEPYAFTTADAQELAAATGKMVKLVDGELFSWYGSRMISAFSYLKRLRAELALIFGEGSAVASN